MKLEEESLAFAYSLPVHYMLLLRLEHLASFRCH